MFSNSDLNRIRNIDSKNYFELVLQAYYSKNNKAAVLLLYNLVVNDLYNKLLLMNEKGYVNCQKDLDDIEKVLKDGNEARYSVVEEKIFDVYKTKKILKSTTIDLLDYLKKTRNKCAHPFFFRDSDYTPIDEEVYLFILKIYNDLLVVEAFFKDPYTAMESDIEAYPFPNLYESLIYINRKEEDIKKVKIFFEKKYFEYMTDNNFQKLFSSLIDLTIAKCNEELIVHQYPHYLLLMSLLMYLRQINKLSILNGFYKWEKIDKNEIKDDVDLELPDQECFSLSYLYDIVSYNVTFIEEINVRNEDLYSLLSSKLYDQAYLFISYWKLFDSDLNNALSKLSNNLSFEDFYTLVYQLYNVVEKEKLVELIKCMLECIPIYDGYSKSDEALELIIEIMPKLPVSFKQVDVDILLGVMNSNKQIYAQSRLNRDRQIRKFIELGYSVDNYVNLQVDLLD